jgi:ABC-type Fe3+ transport system permease subunit
MEVPWFHYHLRVTLPNLLPALFCGLLLVGLATAADASSTLILLPPGAATFTTRIFGVLDSTTERTLSALCLIYIAGGLLVLSVFAYLQPLVRRF